MVGSSLLTVCNCSSGTIHFLCLWGPNYSAWVLSLIHPPAATDTVQWGMSGHCRQEVPHLARGPNMEDSVQIKAPCNWILVPSAHDQLRNAAFKMTYTHLFITNVTITASLYGPLCARCHSRCYRYVLWLNPHSPPEDRDMFSSFFRQAKWGLEKSYHLLQVM